MLGGFIAWLLIDGLISGEVHVIIDDGPNYDVSRDKSPAIYWFYILWYALLAGILFIFGTGWGIREYYRWGTKKKSPVNANTLPAYCSNCNKEGFIEADNFEADYLVICSKCHHKSSYGYCDQCETGGDFIEHVSGHKKDWSCPECNTGHELPEHFYNKPLYIKFKT